MSTSRNTELQYSRKKITSTVAVAETDQTGINDWMSALNPIEISI